MMFKVTYVDLYDGHKLRLSLLQQNDYKWVYKPEF